MSEAAVSIRLVTQGLEQFNESIATVIRSLSKFRLMMGEKPSEIIRGADPYGVVDEELAAAFLLERARERR